MLSHQWTEECPRVTNATDLATQYLEIDRLRATVSCEPGAQSRRAPGNVAQRILNCAVQRKFLDRSVTQLQIAGIAVGRCVQRGSRDACVPGGLL